MKDKWNIVLAVEALIIIFLIGYASSAPCVPLRFEVIPGFNYNQPYPVMEDCR